MLLPVPLIMPCAAMKYTLSFAQFDIFASSANGAGLVNVRGYWLSVAYVHPGIVTRLNTRVNAVAQVSLLSMTSGLNLSLDVPTMMFRLYAFRTSMLFVSVNGFVTAGRAGVPDNASYARTAIAANSARVIGFVQSVPRSESGISPSSSALSNILCSAAHDEWLSGKVED